MEWLGAIGGGSFILASLFVGIRVLWLARRTRELPELTLGIGLVLMGGLSYPIHVAARMSVDLSPDARVGLMFLSQALMWSGCVAIGIFNWRVFRPGSRWALALVVAFATAMVAFMVVQCGTVGMFAYVDAREGVYRFAMTAQGIPYSWGFIESLLYYTKLRRRLVLGIADAAVTNRIGLWTVTMCSAMAINWFMIALEVLGIDSTTAPVAGLFVGPVGLVSTVSLWLACGPGRAGESEPAAAESS